MSNYSFELEEITNIRIMQIECSFCQEEPETVSALVYHNQMTTERDSDEEQDVIAIFCQGRNGCDGQAWAFPVDADSSIVGKHDVLTDLSTNS